MKRLIIGMCGIFYLLVSNENVSAIEGLQISVQGSNVFLSWPSTNTETYIVQYRQTLNATDSWVTLTNDYPASDSNFTFFVHSNIVQYPPAYGGGGTNGGGISPPGPMDEMAGSSLSAGPPMPMVVAADGSSAAVPLALYPPGFDLSGMIIFDPATGQQVSGNGYTIRSSPAASPQGGGFQPDDLSGDTNQYTGFYRVVRDGAHLIGITNGMILSGIVTIPIEVANGFGNLSTVSLTEDDSPIGNSIQNAPFNLPLALTVDTTQMSNGVHQISASARWDISTGTNEEDGGEAEADSPPISVTISNEISFPNWMPEFGELGNSLLFRATSAHTNVDWYVDVYDSHTNYIGTFGGHTDDGDISVVWNLVGPPPNYVNYTNENFFLFYITTPYADPPTSPIYKHWEQWSGHGAWVAVAQHAWDTYNNSDQLYAELSGFIGGAMGVGWQVNPPATQDDYGNWDAYALHWPIGSQGDADWQAFRNALYDPHSRNLVYFGHGGPDGLGYNPATTNRYISATEIGNVLHTIPVGQTNRHSFRFVFLDGCSTAKGSLPEAFGMFHRENVADSDYVNAEMRFSAFVGWRPTKRLARE